MLKTVTIAVSVIVMFVNVVTVAFTVSDSVSVANAARATVSGEEGSHELL